MKLREHPKIHWPPSWSGAYDIDLEEVPIFEQGVLRDVQYPEALTVTNLMFPTHLTLANEYKGNAFGGVLVIDDPALLPSLYHLLRENIGRPIQEIGELEIDF